MPARGHVGRRTHHHIAGGNVGVGEQLNTHHSQNSSRLSRHSARVHGCTALPLRRPTRCASKRTDFSVRRVRGRNFSNDN